MWLQLFGTKDQTPPMQLDDKRNNFERGQHDAFSVKGPDVGEVKKAKLTMDFKGLAAAW